MLLPSSMSCPVKLRKSVNLTLASWLDATPAEYHLEKGLEELYSQLDNPKIKLKFKYLKCVRGSYEILCHHIENKVETALHVKKSSPSNRLKNFALVAWGLSITPCNWLLNILKNRTQTVGSHPLYSNDQHHIPPGLCTWPPPIHAENPWLQYVLKYKCIVSSKKVTWV